MTKEFNELASARLELRPIDRRDAPALHQHWVEPDVRRYLWDDEVISLEQVRDLVDQSEQLFAEQGYGLWSIRRRDSDGLLGVGGYWEFHEPPQLELILSLSLEHWGQGFAVEAGNLLLRYAFGDLGFGEVRASTDRPNKASVRMLERLGFRYSRRAEEGGLDTVFFVLPSCEYGAKETSSG